MSSARRRVFFVSDRTGLSSENMGRALLEQFENTKFKYSTVPYVDTLDKANGFVLVVNHCAEEEKVRPIVFSSIANDEVLAIIKNSNALHLSFFDAFLGVLEEELGESARHSVRGRVQNLDKYDDRMAAVTFALNHDDGVSEKDLERADVILIGVSRSGKTPTCLYLALQYGIFAANYPLIPEDLVNTDLPRMVKPYADKLFGLTILPERLRDIRQERRPNSTYSQMNNCLSEVSDAQAMFRRHNIPFVDTTHKSVEELAVAVLQARQLKRRF